MKTISLCGKWHIISNGRYEEPIDILGNVPGSVLGDIVSSVEKYNNIFWRDSAESVQKFEKYNWIYSKEFEINELYENPYLYFGRLDTYCDIYVNGEHIGYFDNGNISHIIPVDGVLNCGKNKIDIYFYSPIVTVSGRKPYSGAFTTERIHTRRMQCTYGWDWTMRFVTCGIYQDACIIFKDNATIVEDAYVYTKSIDEDSAQIGIDVRFEKNAGGVLSFDIFYENEKCVKHIEKYTEEDFIRLTVDIVNPLLWYPLGYGNQPLYKLKISDKSECLKTVVFGIRTVKVQQISDNQDSDNYNKCLQMKQTPFGLQYNCDNNFSGCILKINGIKIMCKGGNWVPCSPIYTSGLEERITAILERAKSCGINMLRVWGGGQFECEHFYDECSRLGITVCQDFLMACGRYPEDNADFIENLNKEALYASRLLKNKACLVWWHGDNENAVKGCDTDIDYSGRRSAYKGIAPILYKEDPYREFMPSSPFGGNKYASNTAGTTHNSQYLSYFFKWLENDELNDYKEYIDSLNARFIMEDPTMGACNTPSLLKMMTKEDIYGNDLSMWRYHTQSNPALKRHLFDYMDIFSKKVLGDFSDGNDRLFKYKYIQYEWIRLSMERARREKWFCAGDIFWMVNDCWPAAGGWSLIDYYNMPKNAFYAFKRCAKDICASLIKKDDTYVLFVSNDALSETNVEYSIKVLDRLGNIHQIASGAQNICANISDDVYSIKCSVIPDDAVAVIADVYIDKKLCDRTFYKEGSLNIYPSDADIKINTINDNTLEIVSDKYIHALEIEGNAVFDDNCFILLPGEKKTINVSFADTDKNITLTAYTLLQPK